MMRVIACVAAVLAVAALTSAHESEAMAETAGKSADHSGDVSTEFVTMLTGQTIEAFISGHEMVAIHFCWERGANCKVALPIVEEVATDFPQVKFGRLCTVADRDAAAHFDLSHTPSLLFFFEGEEVSRMWDVYGDDREDYTYEKLRRFLGRNTAAPVTVLESADELSSFTVSAELAAVLFTHGDDDDAGALWRTLHHSHNATVSQAFAHVASMLRNEMRFGVVRGSLASSDAAAQALAAAGVAAASLPSVVLYKNHHGHTHEPLAVPPSALGVADLRAFLEVFSHAPFGSINHTNYVHFEAMGLPLAAVFVNEEDTVMLDALRGVFEPLARELRGRMSFGYFCGRTYSAFARTLGIESRRWPQLAVEEVHTHRHFAAPSNLRLTDAKKVRAFVQSVLDNKTEPSIRSAPLPSHTPGAAVTELVGANFATWVLSASVRADVVVMVYAPWSGQAKNSMEPFASVAKVFAREPTVVFAQLDFSKNDVTLLRGNKLVLGMPTILFFPRANISGVVAFEKDDDTHVAALVRDFVIKHSSAQLSAAKFALPGEELPPTDPAGPVNGGADGVPALSVTGGAAKEDL